MFFNHHSLCLKDVCSWLWNHFGRESEASGALHKDAMINSDQGGREYIVYAGTYTNGASKGIYAFRFDAIGKLHPIGLVAETVNPAFLAVHPNNNFLYTVNELKQHAGEATGLVSSYAICRRTGALAHIGTARSRGAGPCHVAIDQSGKFAVVANYVGGSVAVFPLRQDGGLEEASSWIPHVDLRSGTQPRRPHPHGAFFSPDNRLVVVPDLGLETLFVYSIDRDSGALQCMGKGLGFSTGSGPRQFAFHPSGRCGYSVNQCNATVTACHCDSASVPYESFQTVSTLPPDYPGANETAQVEIDQPGRFLYVSNRGGDSIAVFAIDEEGGLRLLQHAPTRGQYPRHFAIDPSGRFLLVANQYTGNLVTFVRDEENGRIAPLAEAAGVDALACVVFVPMELKRKA